MLCCTDLCGNDTTTTSDNDAIITKFPGQRRLMPTGGNAYRDYNPSLDDVVSAKPSTAMLLVQVPQGTQPGEIIHVRIPGEERIIAAQVPPGVTEFHVSYEPMSNSTNQISVYSSQPIRNHNLPTINNNAPNLEYTNPNMKSSSNPSSSSPKMILVQVPYDIPAGSMIQVQVPGEDRFIIAQVPPGVREFYVSSDAATSNLSPNDSYSTMNSNLSPKMDINRNYNNNSWKQHQQQEATQQDSSSNNGVGIVAPIVAGAALMGVAGYMMSQHGFSETNENDVAEDYGGDW